MKAGKFKAVWSAHPRVLRCIPHRSPFLNGVYAPTTLPPPAGVEKSDRMAGNPPSCPVWRGQSFAKLRQIFKDHPAGRPFR